MFSTPSLMATYTLRVQPLHSMCSIMWLRFRSSLDGAYYADPTFYHISIPHCITDCKNANCRWSKRNTWQTSICLAMYAALMIAECAWRADNLDHWLSLHFHFISPVVLNIQTVHIYAIVPRRTRSIGGSPFPWRNGTNVQIFSTMRHSAHAAA